MLLFVNKKKNNHLLVNQSGAATIPKTLDYAAQYQVLMDKNPPTFTGKMLT